MVTSLSALAEGSLNNLYTMCLELTLLRTLEKLLNAPRYLRKITHLPETNNEDLADCQKYANKLKPLFELCADASVLPALRPVHIHPGDGDKLTYRSIRAQILERIWRAAASHGGWKLFAHKPDGSRTIPYLAAHEILWAHKQWEFSMSLTEFEGFKRCCISLRLYPHLDRFIAGKINIRIDGVAPIHGALMRTGIDGLNMSVLHTISNTGIPHYVHSEPPINALTAGSCITLALPPIVNKHRLSVKISLCD